MIEIHDLVKCYDGKTAVDHLSLAVGAGEWLVFAGPNGSGKTTTIKILAALAAPTSGAVRVAGHDVTRRPVEVKRSIGYLPEDLSAFGYLTGLEYLHVIAACHDLAPGIERDRAERLIDLFDLRDYRQTLVRTYSVGLSRRLTLAGALLPDPPILLLDEPTANLDPESAYLVRQVLRGLVERGRTVFMSTHLLTSAEKDASRVAFIKEGKLLLDRSLPALRESFPGDDLETIFLRVTEQKGEERVRAFLDGVPRVER
ncbi:MAG: hypothetical protein A3G34_13555 [Candidatus Lindowbacteria bacterium RIFCSPLOWO2_12_FULL_62_27]|nr:MAG: hypothetical protein A3G34_13555 [Candidatus Lindowbacteria bacterium RIFCSPLOWO2_12_FULL_62_27]